MKECTVFYYWCADLTKKCIRCKLSLTGPFLIKVKKISIKEWSKPHWWSGEQRWTRKDTWIRDHSTAVCFGCLHNSLLAMK